MADANGQDRGIREPAEAGLGPDTAPIQVMDSGGGMSPERAEFERDFHQDEAAGAVLPLSAYLARFPACEREIAVAYLELQGSRLPIRDRVGPYRLLKELGRGGQAVVYLAEDLRLKRQVALKLLQGLGTDQYELRRRFQQGAEVASRLHHPEICAVYDADLDGPAPYVAMQFVPGRSLARVIEEALRGQDEDTDTCLFLTGKQAPLVEETGPQEREPVAATEGTQLPGRPRAAIEEAVRLIESLARTLHFAHENGVLHRDIKPGNVMVTPDGRPILMDFDMARDDRPRPVTLTANGDAFGTPAYMAPEQIRGGAARLDRRADVWSLGVTLFQCVTLRRPFLASTREGVFRSILREAPPHLANLVPEVPPALDRVVRKALSKDPRGRYATALELADELRRVLDDVPVVANRTSTVQRWVQGVRYRRELWVAAGVLAATLAAFAIGRLTTPDPTLPVSPSFVAPQPGDVNAWIGQVAPLDLADAERVLAERRKGTASADSDDVCHRLLARRPLYASVSASEAHVDEGLLTSLRSRLDELEQTAPR